MALSFSLSTHWNAYRHQTGEELVEEILKEGLDRIELGYDLTIDLVPGVRNMVDRKAVTVTSVHSFCPVPMGAPFGHPELFLLTSSDRRVRESAVTQTVRTITFAAEMGAHHVVQHAGRIEKRDLTRKLLALRVSGKQFERRFEKIKLKQLMRREKSVQPYLDRLVAAIEQLMPVLQETGVRLSFENLPSWGSVPSEAEMLAIHEHFDSPHIGYWHDLGHGQVREDLGFTNQCHWLDRLESCLNGMHIHDVDAEACDHLMPPKGGMDFSRFRKFAKPGRILVLEPAPGTPSEDIRAGVQFLQEVWDSPE